MLNLSPRLMQVLEDLWSTPQEKIDQLRSSVGYTAGAAIQTDNGDAALQACRLLILLDVIMGGLTGLENARELAAKGGVNDELFESLILRQLENCGVSFSDEAAPVEEPVEEPSTP